MKTALNVFAIMIIFSGVIFSQPDRWRGKDDDMRGKFEQLEKIKLIEALGMNEDTTLRFFARRSEHQKQQQEIQDKIDKKIEDLDVIFKSGRVATIEEIKSDINEITSLQSQLEKNRVEFINSLSDILSYEQIAKLLIFERKFRDEVRRLIMKERKPPLDRQ